MRIAATRAIAVLALLLASAPLFAQTPPETDGSLIRFGALSIQPSLAVKNIGRDNNVFNDAADPKSDFTITVAPRADIIFQPGRLKLTFGQGTDYVYFRQYASERGVNYASALRAEVDLGVLQPYASVGGTNTRDRYNNEVDARARHRDRSYSAGVALRLFTRTTATIGVRQMRFRFDDGLTFRGENLADAFNSRVDIVEGGVGFALTPLTRFALNVSREAQRFDRAVGRDSRSLRIMPTLTFSPQGLLNGSVAVGYRRFTAEDPGLRDFQGIVASVTARATVYDRHRVDVTVNRDLNYSYEQDSIYYIATGASVTWTFVVAGPFDLKTSAARDQMRYRERGAAGAEADDTYSTYTVGAGYRLRRRLRFGVNADWVRRDSQRSADRTFDNNRIYGTVTWGS